MAGIISKETIDAVRNQTDMLSIIGDYAKLENRGSSWWACCPFHNEKTPSFCVSEEKKFYYCFGCHATGDIIKFMMEIEKVSFTDAVASLARKTGVEIKYENGNGINRQEQKYDRTIDDLIELYERTATMFHYMLLNTEQGKSALEYASSRGLTREIIEKFKIGYSPADRRWLRKFLHSKNFTDEFLDKSGLFSKKYPEIAFFSDRLMFPIFNRKGQAVAFGARLLNPKSENDPKYINSGDLLQYKKGETLYAFNFAKDEIRKNKKVIFCEGYMDCIAYHQAGIEWAVAPLGTALTDDQIKIIKNFADTVFLSFDSDGAGQTATVRAILMCRRHNLSVRIIRLKGGKDPSEILQKFGKNNLTNQVNGSILDCDYLLNRVAELYPVDTPEGKTRAALDFFPYIDSLQSDIQKQSSLDQLCQAFNLKPEAVQRDFSNRNQARDRINTQKIRQENNQTNQNSKLQLNAEIRGILAVTSNLDQFQVLRSEVSENDFQDLVARRIFKVLEECFLENSLSLPDILERCDDGEISALITNSVTSGAYQENAGEVVVDFISFLKKNSIENKINSIQVQINKFMPVSAEDQELLKSLISEKMRLEQEARNLQKRKMYGQTSTAD